MACVPSLAPRKRHVIAHPHFLQMASGAGPQQPPSWPLADRHKGSPADERGSLEQVPHAPLSLRPPGRVPACTGKAAPFLSTRPAVCTGPWTHPRLLFSEISLITSPGRERSSSANSRALAVPAPPSAPREAFAIKHFSSAPSPLPSSQLRLEIQERAALGNSEPVPCDPA
uniref:Uncharacterized protein n=1 Tax=Pipistrellus kuhlii TaxID=59472 RepID=A0A7J7Y8Y1_PIPKU|nr:hypothetical protein mPipKuh1_010249 [Pipistrellus kuhlii]